MLAMLRGAGLEMFGHKPVDDSAVAELLSGLQPWDWSGAVVAGPEAFAKRILASHDSSPGVDGIPYSAYKACVGRVSAILFGLSRQVATYGVPIP
eukprot:378797-Karenia_brevis.AAC.1